MPNPSPASPNGDSEASQEPAGNLPASIHPRGIRDTRLVERAFRERWPIAGDCRKALIQRQIDIATDPNSSSREATLAFKSILAAEAQNQADEHKLLPDLHTHVHADLSSISTDRLRELAGLAEQFEHVAGIDLLEETNQTTTSEAVDLLEEQPGMEN